MLAGVGGEIVRAPRSSVSRRLARVGLVLETPAAGRPSRRGCPEGRVVAPAQEKAAGASRRSPAASPGGVAVGREVFPAFSPDRDQGRRGRPPSRPATRDSIAAAGQGDLTHGGLAARWTRRGARRGTWPSGSAAARPSSARSSPAPASLDLGRRRGPCQLPGFGASRSRAEPAGLAEKIVSFGGEPTTEVAPLRYGPGDPRAALGWLCESEEEPIEALQESIEPTGREGRSEALEHMLEHQLMRKQEQVDFLRRALGSSGRRRTADREASPPIRSR